MTQTETAAEKDLLISLTLHNFPAEMLKEFAQKIVKPYFGGNLNQAFRTLMDNAINEENITNKAITKESMKASNKLR
ncbi:MAG: hypothetical protein ACM3UL_04760 [Ignavibacteria bacterium]